LPVQPWPERDAFFVTVCDRVTAPPHGRYRA